MASSAPLLRASDISLTFGGTPLLTDVSFSVRAGDRIALVGRNGSGKSTLLKIVANLVQPTNGEVTSERNTTVRYLRQQPDFGDHTTLGDYVVSGLSPLDDPHQALALLANLGLDAERGVDALSGGEARRAALAQVLAAKPDILLLDEPTNHLDLPVIEWLEGELSRTKSALVLISHDRRFLDNTTNTTLWLDRGVVREHSRGFAFFEEWRDKVLEEEERDLHKLKRKIVREEHWVTYGVSARRKRNMRRMGELQQLRTQYRDHQRAEGTAKLEAIDARATGKVVIEADGLAKTLGGKPLVRDFSIRINRGDRIGLIGPNGAGKTTLIKMLIGELAPDEGTVKLGTHLESAFLDQKRDALDPNETLEHFLTDGRGQNLIVNGEQKHVMSYMQDFLFKPEQARTPVRELSGGEKARLVLAKILSRPANLLILDEPTNDLDMETLDLLQELVAGFAGTVLLVSHDRDFLDRTVNAVIAPDEANPGRWITYAGGYTDMLAQRGAVAKEQDKAKKEQAKAAKPKAKSSAKMSYKDKYALETLPSEIEKLEAEIEQLTAEMADPNLFAAKPDRFAEVSKLIGNKQALRDEKEERWLELEMLREELEG